MQRIGLQRFAGVLVRHLIERPRACNVDGQRGKEYQNRCEARFNVNGMKEQAIKGLIDDVKSRNDEQSGFQKCRKILKLSVSVRMPCISRLIGNANGQKRNHRGDQIKPGMQRFGKHAKAARPQNKKSLKAKQQRRGADAQQCSALLFLAGFM